MMKAKLRDRCLHSSAILIAILLASASWGCSIPHHVLSAPSATASEAERIAAYERLFVRASAGTVLTDGSAVVGSTDFLVLGDGTRIVYAEDLLPVVDPDSPTGRAARRIRSGRARSHPWGMAGGLSFGAGIITSVALVYYLKDDGKVIGGFAGVTSGFVVGLAFAMVAIAKEGDLSGDRISAFTTYNSDLLKHLDLCVVGTRVRACNREVPERPTEASSGFAPGLDRAMVHRHEERVSLRHPF